MAAAAVERLPPGVYFNPSPEECVNDYLLPWSRGERLPEMGRYIHEESIYRQGPDALRRMHAPGTTRAFEPKWYFLSRCKRRGGRTVATGGTWTVEQKQRILESGDDGGDDVPGGTRKNYGFFVGEKKKKEKTPWLMEEFTASDDGGGGKDAEVPVLCRIYVSPRATNDEKRAVFGEDGVAVDANKKKKPERVVLPADHFDALAKLLPASCRRVGTGKGQAAPPPHVLGHPHAQPALPPPPVLLAPQINPTPPQPVLLGRQRSHAVPPPVILGPHDSQAVLQSNVPVHPYGSPLPPSPRPDVHRSAPSSVDTPTQQQEEAMRPGKRCHVLRQQEEEAIRPGKRARLHHAPPPQPQDTVMDALQSEILQGTEPAPTLPLPQEMLPFDACQAANEPFRGSFLELLETPLPPFADDVDFGKLCESSLQLEVDDGEALPMPLNVDFVAKEDFSWCLPQPT